MNARAPWKDNLLKITLGISQFNTNQNQTSKQKQANATSKHELDVYVCIRKQTHITIPMGIVTTQSLKQHISNTTSQTTTSKQLAFDTSLQNSHQKKWHIIQTQTGLIPLHNSLQSLNSKPDRQHDNRSIKKNCHHYTRSIQNTTLANCQHYNQ